MVDVDILEFGFGRVRPTLGHHQRTSEHIMEEGGHIYMGEICVHAISLWSHACWGIFMHPGASAWTWPSMHERMISLTVNGNNLIVQNSLTFNLTSSRFYVQISFLHTYKKQLVQVSSLNLNLKDTGLLHYIRSFVVLL